jgi:hypothetical protein
LYRLGNKIDRSCVERSQLFAQLIGSDQYSFHSGFGLEVQFRRAEPLATGAVIALRIGASGAESSKTTFPAWRSTPRSFQS